jgi:fumarate hydratase subunit beta
MKKISTPLTDVQTDLLKAGDAVLLSGTLYTGRDQAHERWTEALRSGKRLPLDLRGQVIYYCGPTRTPRGKVIGSCGPTTSRRMDPFTPILLKAGVKGMIGKGRRCPAVREAIRKYRAVYFLAFSGCGALISKYVRKASPVAFKELGPEAVYRLEVKDFPLIVGIDSRGGSVY